MIILLFFCSTDNISHLCKTVIPTTMTENNPPITSQEQYDEVRDR